MALRTYEEFKAEEIMINEIDQIITIDEREMLSGYIGMFPMIVMDENLTEGRIDLGEALAIKVVENPSTGHRFTIEFDEEVFELRADEFLEGNGGFLLVGAPGHRLYGLKALAQGDHTISLNLVSPSGDVVKTIIFTVGIGYR